MANTTYQLSSAGQFYFRNPARNKKGQISTTHFKRAILIFAILNGNYTPSGFKRFVELFDPFVTPDLEPMPTRSYPEWKHNADSAKEQLLRQRFLVANGNEQFDISPEMMVKVHAQISECVELNVASSINPLNELERFWELWAKGANYFCGNGVPQDYAEAVKWWRVAAEKGDTGSQESLGECYENGLGVDRDYVEAVKWYRKAAEQGNKSAAEKVNVLSAKMSKTQSYN